MYIDLIFVILYCFDCVFELFVGCYLIDVKVVVGVCVGFDIDVFGCVILIVVVVFVVVLVCYVGVVKVVIFGLYDVWNCSW